MSALGIIVEYNPFHNGHLFHLQQAKKITNAKVTIAVMSGSFLQRGEPAIVDKWTRTKMALAQGIDLVIEIPTIYATQSADWFALGSASLLHHVGVDHLVFGSETDSIDILHDIANVLLEEPPKLKKYIKNHLSLGNSYPKALSLSLEQFFDDNRYAVFNPNDILGIQYLLNLKKIKSSMKTHTIKRKYAQYNDQSITDQPVASATAIRKSIFTSKSLENIKSKVPKSTYDLLLEAMDHHRINAWNNYLQTLYIIANSKNIKQLKEIHGINEGFEQRIKETINQYDSFDYFIDELKTKRYTSTKIQRSLLHLLLDLTKAKVSALHVNNGPQYIRVLGFNDTGRAHLNRIKHNTKIPIITNIPRDKSPMLEVDIYASHIYELGFNKPSRIKKEYSQTPIYLR